MSLPRHPDGRTRRQAYAGGARRAVRTLGTLQPLPGPRWPLALQAAAAMAVPALVGVAAGYQGLGLLASTGAFTVVHVSALSAAERAKVLPVFAVMLTVAAALGVAVSGSALATGVGLVVVSVLSAAGYYAFRVGPPGPVFLVLVYGLSAHVTAPVDGVRHIVPLAVVTAVACGTAFAYLVSLSPLLRARHRVGARPLREILPGPGLDTTARELLVRVAIVAVVGTALSFAYVDPTRSYWVVGAGVAVIGARSGRGTAATRALHRIVGTVAGAGVYLAIAWIPLHGVAVALVLGALQFVVEMIVIRHYALALTFITPLVLILTGAAAGTAGSIATVGERVVDTLVGASLAAVTGLVHGRRRVGA